jgi:hypothetical protein
LSESECVGWLGERVCRESEGRDCEEDGEERREEERRIRRLKYLKKNRRGRRSPLERVMRPPLSAVVVVSTSSPPYYTASVPPLQIVLPPHPPSFPSIVPRFLTAVERTRTRPALSRSGRYDGVLAMNAPSSPVTRRETKSVQKVAGRGMMKTTNGRVGTTRRFGDGEGRASC